MPRTASPPAASAVVPTAAQWATAFDGQLPPARPTLAYRASTLAVLVVMLLLPVCYVGMIATAAAGVFWYATHATVMFTGLGRGGGRAVLLLVVIYVAPIIAGGLLVVFMVLPLFRRREKRGRTVWVDRREQPLLYAYVDKLCDAMRAPRPARIDVVPMPTASAHIDNGLFGLFNRRLVLTVGLPLAAAFDLRQFTAVVAHEFGHFAQGGSMRASYAVHRINGWFVRLAYERTAADDLIASVAGHDAHWSLNLIGLTGQLTLWVARLLLRGMAVVSHATSMNLSRHAEFDADRQAARVVGGDAMAAALEALPYLSTAGELAARTAAAGWARRELPDDLVVLTHGFAGAIPATARAKIEAGVLSADAKWFDTHPPLFKRIAEVKRAGLPGVLRIDAPAACLFRDFDELCKMATIGQYQAAFGDKLQPEHLYPTSVPAAAVGSGQG